MSPWPEADFDDLVSDETGGNAKTLQSDYLPEGTYPIVDQGQSLIGGYTNDHSRVCKAELPVIVFGDHTKCFKYIDFPFCLGADGTKVLRPKQIIDERYLFYALQRIHIPNAGYSRHFKYLKEGKIPLPPLKEQKRIAAILDQADELRRKRQRALNRLNQLGQAIFIEMFGDPTSPNTQNLRPLVECMRLINGRAYRKEEERETGTPVLRIQNLNGGNRWFYSDLTLPENKYCVDGDLLFAWSATFGPYIWRGHRAIYHYHIWKIEPVEGVCNKLYAYQLLSLLSDSVKAGGRGISMTHATKSGMEQRLIPMPAYEEQIIFADRMLAVQRLALVYNANISKAEDLFSCLQHRAFGGELNAASLTEAAE